MRRIELIQPLERVRPRHEHERAHPPHEHERAHPRHEHEPASVDHLELGDDPGSAQPLAPDTDVRLPAKFTIRAGGVLDPPQIGAPKHTDVAMTVVSGDGMSHTFGLDTPRPHLAMVLSGRPIKLLLKGLLNGTYAVEIDRVKRGALVIGAAPGP